MQVILEQIRNYADNAHGEQRRRYKPDRYIVHPIRVMETCRQYTDSLPVLAAALLHDVLEDTPVSEDELYAFLHTVMSTGDADKTLNLVVEMTDVYVKSKYPNYNRKMRKKLELTRIAKTSPEAHTIKYADILDNTFEIITDDPDFAPRYLRECLAILTVADKGNRVLYKIALEAVRGNLKYL